MLKSSSNSAHLARNTPAL